MVSLTAYFQYSMFLCWPVENEPIFYLYVLIEHI